MCRVQVEWAFFFCEISACESYSQLIRATIALTLDLYIVKVSAISV